VILRAGAAGFGPQPAMSKASQPMGSTLRQ